MTVEPECMDTIRGQWWPRVTERKCHSIDQTIRTPVLWLCQNLRNQVLLSRYSDLRHAPILVSLGDAFQRPSYKDRFFTEKLRENLGINGPVMVDSGGFALMARRNALWSMREVKRIYCKLPADILVSLDHPPSPLDDLTTRKLLRTKTIRNLKLMCDFVSLDRLMPVAHGHNVQELERSCEQIARICPKVSQVGIGGLVPLICSGAQVPQFTYTRKDGTLGDRRTWISDALQIVREAFPLSLVHVFGIGSATTAIAVLGLGADSVDSLSWRRVANYGAILLPGCSERFPTYQWCRNRSRPVVSESESHLILECGCPCCREVRSVPERLRRLAGCYKNRAIHNAWTVLEEVAKFRSAIEQNRALAFLVSRLTPVHRLYKPIMERWSGQSNLAFSNLAQTR